MTPASAIATALAEAGVTHLFGMPGGGNNLDVIGACAAEGIRFVLAHTETAAAIMATAHAELTGTVGVCVVTRGPGAASAVNGAAQAQQDRQPLLVLTDTVSAPDRPRIAHQAIDQPAMFAPVTKWSATVGSVDPLGVVRDAIAVAMSSPRGAVHLDVDPGSTHRADPPVTSGGGGSFEDLEGFFAAAERPVLVVGVGARPHTAAVRALVAGTRIPVFSTYKARGVVPDDGPNSAGPFTGSRTDGLLLAQADLVVTIGLDSIELIPNAWPYEAPVVAIAESVDPYGYFSPAVTLLGPPADLLRGLPVLRDGWASEAGPVHRMAVDRALETPTVGTEFAPDTVVRAVRAAAPAGSVATVDAGAHMLVAMPLWTVQEPGEVLTSSGLATMGYALPAAIGAALARPDRRVYCLVGDGGLQMALAELETLARIGANVTVVVFNDATLSLIKAKQQPSGHGGGGAVEFAFTDFAAVARAMGVGGHTVSDGSSLSALARTDAAGPVLLDVRVDPDAYRRVIDVTRNAHLDP